jgi:hypothetical protein
MAAAPPALGTREEAMSGRNTNMDKPLLRARLPEWPCDDCAAWQRALVVPSSRFTAKASVPARSNRKNTTPSQATIELREKAFGTFVAFLMRQGGDLGASALPHVTHAALDAWIADQKCRGNRETTISKRIENLQGALRMIAPERDFGFLRRPAGRPLHQVLSRRPRPVETRDSREIIDRIRELHAAARAGGHRYAKGHTVLRDAALLALLGCRGPRIGEVYALTIGRTLVWHGERWEMRVEAEDNKSDHPRRVALPGWVQPILTDYIRIARPAFGGHTTPALWLSTRKHRCPVSTLTRAVVYWTRHWFGTAHGPHWLRKCLTTTVANERPDLLPDVALVLDHGTTVALQHYNLAETLMAGQRHNARMDRLLEDSAAQGWAFLTAQRPKRYPPTWTDRYPRPGPTPGPSKEEGR